MMNSLKFTIYVKRLQPCPAVTRNMKKGYKNTLADTHTHSIHLYKKTFREKKKINKDESHAQQQSFPV